MKKFLNYILVAGVAVLGFAGTAYAADPVDPEVANLVEKVNDAIADVNGKIEIKATQAVLDGADGAELKNAAIEKFTKEFTTSDYDVVYDGSKLVIKKFKADVLVGSNDKYESDSVEMGSLTLSSITFEPADINSVDEKNINAKVKMITDAAGNSSSAAITLQDVEAIEFYAKDAKPEDAYKYSSAYRKVVASENGITVEEEYDKDTKKRYVTAYKGDVQVSAKTEIFVAVAEVGDIDLYVPTGTKPENVESVLRSRIEKAIAGTNAKITELKVEKAGTPAKLVIDSPSKNIINEDQVRVLEVRDLAAVTPIDETKSNTITSNTTDVTVAADKAVEAGTNLVVTKVENPTEAAKAVAKAVGDIVVYDIKLVNAKGENVTFDGVEYTVTITIPEKLKGKKLAAYTLVKDEKGNERLEEHKIEVKGDKGTFTTKHFSEWIISEVVKVDENGKVLPNTLDNAASFAFVGVIGLVGMAASALFLNKRN